MRIYLQYLGLVLLPILGGCASTSTQMVNDDGQVVNCGAWGFGIIGAPAALISTQACINKYQAAGYREIGSPQSPENAHAPGTPITLTAKDGAFKIALPAGWIQANPPSQAYQFYAKNPLIDAGLLVSTAEIKNIQDWQAFSESLRSKLRGNLTQSSSSEPLKTVINGLDAYRAEVSGVAKNGVKLHYLSTVIKTDNLLIYLVSWCVESKFQSNRGALEQIASGVQL